LYGNAQLGNIKEEAKRMKIYVYEVKESGKRTI